MHHVNHSSLTSIPNQKSIPSSFDAQVITVEDKNNHPNVLFAELLSAVRSNIPIVRYRGTRALLCSWLSAIAPNPRNGDGNKSTDEVAARGLKLPKAQVLWLRDRFTRLKINWKIQPSRFFKESRPSRYEHEDPFEVGGALLHAILEPSEAVLAIVNNEVRFTEGSSFETVSVHLRCGDSGFGRRPCAGKWSSTSMSDIATCAGETIQALFGDKGPSLKPHATSHIRSPQAFVASDSLIARAQLRGILRAQGFSNVVTGVSDDPPCHVAGHDSGGKMDSRAAPDNCFIATVAEFVRLGTSRWIVVQQRNENTKSGASCLDLGRPMANLLGDRILGKCVGQGHPVSGFSRFAAIYGGGTGKAIPLYLAGTANCTSPMKAPGWVNQGNWICDV
jgi:hypothetical protein